MTDTSGENTIQPQQLTDDASGADVDFYNDGEIDEFFYDSDQEPDFTVEKKPSTSDENIVPEAPPDEALDQYSEGEDAEEAD
jgi:hypothetical protein